MTMEKTYEDFYKEACPQDTKGDGHLIHRKWNSQDKECFKCEQCGEEFIVFKNSDSTSLNNQ